jgi:hypothetical protein
MKTSKPTKSILKKESIIRATSGIVSKKMSMTMCRDLAKFFDIPVPPDDDKDLTTPLQERAWIVRLERALAAGVESLRPENQHLRSFDRKSIEKVVCKTIAKEIALSYME